MYFLIHSSVVFYTNYPMNMKAVHSAFYSYQFITLSKIWVTIFDQLYPCASVSKAKQEAVCSILGQLRKVNGHLICRKEKTSSTLPGSS